MQSLFPPQYFLLYANIHVHLRDNPSVLSFKESPREVEFQVCEFRIH